MLLNEIFQDTDVDIHWHGNDATFQFGEYQYIIQTIPMRPNDMIHGPISDQPITNRTYFFSFAAQKNPYDYPIDTDLNIGRSISVFSIIIQELLDFVKRKKVDMLYFGCEANHEKRKRLYGKMVKKYTEITGWRVIAETQAEYFGSMKHLWIIKKD